MPRAVYVVPHTHWDREWYMPHELFRWRLTQMVDSLLDHMEHQPEYRCFNLDGQSIVVDDYLAMRPESRERLAALIQAGRLLIGPWWVQPDEWLPSAESHVRNLQLGIREAEKFGGCMMIGHCADQFGHIAQLPQLFAQLGLTSACLWRGVGDDVPGWSFWWEAPDGTRLPVLYLRDSYSNGLNLPANPDDLRYMVHGSERARRDGEPALLMNGSDHTFFEPGVPEIVARGLDGYNLVMASLAEYERAMFDAGIDEHVHSGELRSTNRSNILTGTLSARMNLKQRDFAISSLLERYAEPLEYAAHEAAGYDGLAALKFAWRVFLENAPHDSICGCSIDQTHREMLPRYDRAEQLARRVGEEAVAALLPGLATGAGAIAVYRPAGGGPVPFRASVAADWGQPALALHGEPLPVAYGEPVAGELLARRILTVTGAIAHLDAVARGGTVDGRRVQRVVLEPAERGFTLTTIVGQGLVQLDTSAARDALHRSLDDGSVMVSHVTRVEDTCEVAGVLPETEGLELALLVPSPVAGPIGGVTAGPLTIANEFFRVHLAGTSLEVVDLATGQQYAGINGYAVEGDRGDEYNADITSSVVVALQAESHSSESSGVFATLRYQLLLDVTERLNASRDGREGQATIVIDTTVTLWTGVRRVDFETVVVNQAQDARLRSLFPVPFQTGTVLTEAHFYVAERRVEPESWNGQSAERPSPTFPQKTFAALEHAGRGFAVFNRGLPEGEVVTTGTGQSYALTLLRAVGWLSRPDLQSRAGGAGPTIRTHDSQMPGTHRFEYAWTTYDGTWSTANVQATAHDFAYPPTTWLAAGFDGGQDSLGIVSVDGATLSALHRSHVDGRPVVRVYRSSNEPGIARVRLASGITTVHQTNLLEREPRPVRTDDEGGWAVALRPWEIATFQVGG